MIDDPGLWDKVVGWVFRVLEWVGAGAIFLFGYIMSKINKTEARLNRHEEFVRETYWKKSEIKEEIEQCTRGLRLDISRVESAVDKVHSRLDDMMKFIADRGR